MPKMSTVIVFVLKALGWWLLAIVIGIVGVYAACATGYIGSLINVWTYPEWLPRGDTLGELFVIFLIAGGVLWGGSWVYGEVQDAKEWSGW